VPLLLFSAQPVGAGVSLWPWALAVGIVNRICP
jgi:hypothetical protein